MIVKRASTAIEVARRVTTQAELRDQLIELWAEIFERELRADIEAAGEASGERARLRAIERAEPISSASRHRMPLED